MHPRRVHRQPAHITEQDASGCGEYGRWVFEQQVSSFKSDRFSLFLCLFLSRCSEQCEAGGDVSFRMAAVGSEHDVETLLSTKYAHFLFLFEIPFTNCIKCCTNRIIGADLMSQVQCVEQCPGSVKGHRMDMQETKLHSLV